MCAQAVASCARSPLSGVLGQEHQSQLHAHQGRRPWTAGARTPRDTGQRKDADVNRRLLQGFTNSRSTTQLYCAGWAVAESARRPPSADTTHFLMQILGGVRGPRLSPLVLLTENSRQRAPSTRGDSLGAHQGRRPWTAGFWGGAFSVQKWHVQCKNGIFSEKMAFLVKKWHFQ